MEVKKGRNRDTRESHSSTAGKQKQEEHKCRKLDFPACTVAAAPLRRAPRLPTPPSRRPSILDQESLSSEPLSAPGGSGFGFRGVLDDGGLKRRQTGAARATTPGWKGPPGLGEFTEPPGQR